jgi:diamine N-acetyltransferase
LFAIRRAGRHDAKQLSLLAEETFRDTFGAVNAPENMALHCRASYSEAIQAREISDPNMVTLLCECEERLVGFAQLRWGDAPGCVKAMAPGEIQRLYVASDCHGNGAARELMNACIEELRDRRSDVVWLGVWEQNPRAIAFYKKSGFVEVGTHVFPLGSDPQRDIVMARSVAGGSLGT